MRVFYFILLILSPILVSANAVVAPNRSFETIPLRSMVSGAVIGTANVGDACGAFSHATGRGGRFRYYQHTNSSGLTGHVICVEMVTQVPTEIENSYLQLVPGRIEFEDYTVAHDSTPETNQGGVYRDDFGVDIESVGGEPNAFSVSALAEGEWLEYEVEVETSGLYQVSARYARVEIPGAPFRLSLAIDSQQVYVSQPTGILGTGGLDIWGIEDVGVLFLPAGGYTFRLTIDSGSIRLDWFELTPVQWLTINVIAIS